MRRFVEFRNEGGVLSGTALTYGEVARIGGEQGFDERFEPGSIRFDDVILNLQHDRMRPVSRTGAGLTLNNSKKALTLTTTLPDTPYGREARELVDAGILRGFSIEFAARQEQWRSSTRVITSAIVSGIGLVDRPAYPGSTVNRAYGAAFGVQLRGPDITGEVILGEEGITSAEHRRRLIVLPDAIEDVNAMDVFLLDGYSYNRAVASVGAGTLNVSKTKDRITFSTRKLQRITSVKEARQRLRAGMLNGVVPGLLRDETEMTKDEDGGTTETIKKARLCELNLIARKGLGRAGATRRTRTRSRRWYW